MSAKPHSKGGGVLAIWTDVRPEDDADFNNWYNRDHLPERTAHPGFLNGRRYKAISGSPRYMTLYDTQSPDALSHTIYRQALENPSSGTRRIMPSFQNSTRSVFRIDYRFGAGLGGVVATIRPQNDCVAASGFCPSLADAAFPALMDCDGVISVEYLSVAPGFAAADASDTTEGALRAKPDSTTPWAIIIGATELGLLRAALNKATPREALREHAGVALKIGMYRFLYAL
jgi:hypothetical protein